MPEYKLTYFNARGMGELIRWLFLYADIPFTEERVEMEAWPEKKKLIPGGKLPILEVDDKWITQSSAIGRLLATKAGLVPQCPWRAAVCDALVDTFKDVLFALFDIMMPEHPISTLSLLSREVETKTVEEKLKELREGYLQHTLGPMMDRLEKRLEKREWFIDDRMTWADLAIGRVMEEVFGPLPELRKTYPKVNALAERIYQLPRIKEHRETRPVSTF